MTIDRTTKVLLTLLVIGVWAPHLRTVVQPAQAQEPGGKEPGKTSWYISSDMSGIYVFRGDTIYRYQSNLGKPVSTAHLGDLPEKR